jgi:hypothetical protein
MSGDPLHVVFGVGQVGRALSGRLDGLGSRSSGPMGRRAGRGTSSAYSAR